MVITGFQVTYGQSSMTDTQVMEFVVKEQGKGTSQAQIVTKLMQNGVDISQIRRVRNTYEKMKKVMPHWERPPLKNTTEAERITGKKTWGKQATDCRRDARGLQGCAR